MFDSATFKDAHCTSEERLSCLHTIEHILSLHKIIQECGLLVLEEEIEKNKNTMLSKGLTLILGGASTEVTRQVMANYVYSSNCKGKSLLEKMIIAEGIVFLQAFSDYSRFLGEVLISYIGEELIEEAENYLYEANLLKRNHRITINQYISSILENQGEHPKTEDSLYINVLSEHAYLCRDILKKVGIDSFAGAMSCISAQKQMRILYAFSPPVAYELVMQLSKLDDSDDSRKICLTSKQKIEDEVRLFEKMGFVVIPHDSSFS